MPPEADSPPAVVLGPSSRWATPRMRVRTSSPVPAGVDFLRVVDAVFAVVALREVTFFEEVFEAAFLAVAFFFGTGVFFALAFPFFDPAFGFEPAEAFFAVVPDFFLAAFERLLEVRAAMSFPPS